MAEKVVTQKQQPIEWLKAAIEWLEAERDETTNYQGDNQKRINCFNLVIGMLKTELQQTRAQPKYKRVDLDEMIETICRRLHSQAYCNENVDNEWMDFKDDANEIICDIKSKYEICAEANILDEEGACRGRLYHCRCPLCGNMKKFEFRVGEDW